MQIEPFYENEKWIIVTDANVLSDCRECAVKAHWTPNRTWSETEPPMTFESERAAKIYLHMRREDMEKAPFE